MKARIYRLLNIKTSESTYIFDLLRIQLFIGIANSFINIAAFTYFIYHYSVDGLPYVYLAIAGGLLLINIGYEKLEHRLSPLQLLKIIVSGSAAIVALFWFGFLVWNLNAMIFLLAVWSMLFYMVTGYAYWGLVSLLFNIRESKRVFSIVGAGDIPAKLIGYLCAPVLIHFIGINNLLILSFIALGISWYFTNKLIKKKRFNELRAQPHHDHIHHHSKGLSDFLKNNFFINNRLIFAISILAILSYNVFNFIDFTFISQIKLKYKNISQLAAFVAVFFAVGRFVALVLKLIFTSRLIERLGVIICLLITPIILFVLSIAFLAFNDRSHYSLYFFGIMALITEVLRSTIQEPSFFILFQPLNEQGRLKGHIIAKGYMLPPSLIIVGLSLIILKDVHVTLSISFTIKILLANLALWAIVVYFIKKEYLQTLHKSIARGTFTAEEMTVFDQKAIDLLLEKLKNKNKSDNIYSLKLLEKAGYEHLDELLLEQLANNSEKVRKFALERLQYRGKLNSNNLKGLLQIETDPEIREKIVSALCKLDSDYLHHLSERLSEQELSIRKIIIIHLVEQTEFEYLYIAGREINSLIKSGDPVERELALEIISELKNIKFSTAIEQLINDAEPSVKRTAIIAACKLRTRNLLPYLLDLLDTNKKYIVLQGLMQYGDSLFEDLDILTDEQIQKNKLNLIKIAEKAKGLQSTRFLLRCLNDNAYTEKIIHALWLKGYQAEMVETLHKLREILEIYLANGVDKINLQPSINSEFSMQLIKQSLFSEIRNDLITALKICAIVYHKKEINRVLEIFENNNQNKIFNAMEMMEMVLPKPVSRQVNVLLDYLLDPVVFKRKLAMMPANNFYNLVIQSNNEKFNQWTKSVCLYTSFKNGDFQFLQNLSSKTGVAESTIFSETKNYVLKAIQSPAYADH
jgi:ATP:ADP antiporter, AAA family